MVWLDVIPLILGLISLAKYMFLSSYRIYMLLFFSRQMWEIIFEWEKKSEQDICIINQIQNE